MRTKWIFIAALMIAPTFAQADTIVENTGISGFPGTFKLRWVQFFERGFWSARRLAISIIRQAFFHKPGIKLSKALRQTPR